MRRPRELSFSGIYHVMIRGNGKRNIFYEDMDRIKFLKILDKKIKGDSSVIFAYCLMNNHVHLVIKEKSENISTIMKRINTSYAMYFNRKYNRTGHVFQDRFKSEPIENDVYLLEAIRYIHNNPIKANIVKNKDDYKWSSYKFYINSHDKYDFLDVDFVLNMFSTSKEKAIKMFMEYSNRKNKDKFIDIEEDKDAVIKDLFTVDDIENTVLTFLKKHRISFDELIKDSKNRKLRNELIVQLKSRSTFSNYALAEILNIDRNIIQRAK